MWHTDALDTIDDHLGVLSKFSDLHNQSSNELGDVSDVWITSITISHWRLQDYYETYSWELEDEGQNEEDKQQKTRGPLSWSPCAEESGQHQLSTIRELSMSLVFTGDRMGRCWTCTIISEVMNEVQVAQYVEEIKNVQQMFIHQQYTARVLSFILLLGYLCESLAKECENFTEELDKIMGLNPKVLLKGIEWHKSDVALRRLKKMLWGLEALRVFDDKLKQALLKIGDGKAAMDDVLVKVSELRHKDMKMECEKIREEYTKRFSRLENAHSSIRERIEHSSRLREGITSVLSVEQNENISMLTWVTIAYLPLAFISGIFSMGHGIVPPTASWGTFGWLVAVFVLGTILFALSLQVIIARLRRVEKHFDKLLAHESVKTPAKYDFLVEEKSHLRAFQDMLGFGNGLRRRTVRLDRPESDAQSPV
ncbi:hypothetical protein BGZ60DRAFT_390281 [Tricladium varicosporioides]|nr:hypothetical protein BGZ60DRAFT_390281 [Hymenoscyphus varicosporioides]